ncbi:TPR Domain containing protein [Tritrichomonas foetus]|uniref:TPR Domain containing protein n=1 Tax=Tritrichomonas foetus TaxID=1144522 RepID=A0A1J4KXA7_9EUKA|nr:TPR Domain containing protein [Tritrichomonas foetus]|eukprot:OHT14189.1 TPR Domain containing protein [Tritrichomonas foetus]
MNEVIEAVEFSLRFRMYENAILLCQEFFNRQPSPQLLYLYARSYIDSGSQTQAIVLLSKYDRYICGNPEIILLYAQAYFDTGKYDSAESTLKRFDVSKSNDTALQKQLVVAYHHLLGLIKSRTHRHTYAKDEFRQCLKHNKYIASAVKYIGLDPKGYSCLQNLSGQNHGASNYSVRSTPILKSFTPRRAQYKPTLLMESVMSPNFDLFTNFSPDEKEFITSLKSTAIYYFNRSRYLESASVFRQLYETHPYCVDGLDIYSTALWQLKDSNELNLLAKKSISMAPNRPEPWIVMGNCLSLQQDNEEAIKMFQRAAKISSSCSYALALAGHEYLLLDMYPEAASSFRTSLDRNPYEWSAWYGLGEVFFRQDNFYAAEYNIRKALDLNPASSILCYVYGMVLRRCRKVDGAITMFQKALELDPTNVMALYQQGLLFYDQGDLEKAKECFGKTGSLAHHEPTIDFLQGKIAQQLGDFKMSLLHFVDAYLHSSCDRNEISNNIEGMLDYIVENILKDGSNSENEENNKNSQNKNINNNERNNEEKDNRKDNDEGNIEVENVDQSLFFN